MTQYVIWCEGLQLGEEEEIIEASSQNEALTAAYELACEYLRGYAGLYGIPDDTEDSIEEEGYESWDDVVSQNMNYGAFEYKGKMKYS